ncbi:MAG TPA: hypothetical protein VE820_06270 [Sphingomicrobium sp.]|nr:hypothetical protein [Sphingomicrobium sp.]
MISALLILAQIVPIPAEPAPIKTTIAAVRANPKKFDGQVVELHGYVNRCSALDCAIAEHQASSPGGLGELLSIAPDPKFDATIGPLVPTYVELDARLDAACIINVCAGRPPVLTVVTLRAVVSPEPPPFEKP